MAEPITNVLGIVGMENKGAYDADTYYEKLNVVSYQGSSYCALDSVHNVLPTDTTKWQLIAEKGDKGDTGEEGYTPIKGTDYYTAEDKAELESTLSNDVTSEVTDQLGDLTSATPLAASSTAGMTDTTRIYVNTTDGHWYWYDGNDWQDGGTYQATAIADNSITPESVNFLDKGINKFIINDTNLNDVHTYQDNDGYINVKGTCSANGKQKIGKLIVSSTTNFTFKQIGSRSFPIYIVDSSNNVVATITAASTEQDFTLSTGQYTIEPWYGSGLVYNDKVYIEIYDKNNNLLIRRTNWFKAALNLKSNNTYNKDDEPVTNFRTIEALALNEQADYPFIFDKDNRKFIVNNAFLMINDSFYPGIKFPYVDYLNTSNQDNYEKEIDLSTSSSGINGIFFNIKTLDVSIVNYNNFRNISYISEYDLPLMFYFYVGSTGIIKDYTFISKSIKLKDDYSKKYISICGVSIDTYAGWIPSGNASYYNSSNLTSVNDTWWMKLIRKLNLQLLVNNSWSGARASTTKGVASSGVQRCLSLDDGVHNPDYIIIGAFALNEWTNSPLGTYEIGSTPLAPVNADLTDQSVYNTYSDVLETYKGAMATMINRIQTKYPNAKLFAMDSYNYYRNGTNPTYNTVTNTNIKEYNEALYDVCSSFGVEVIKLSECGFTGTNTLEYTVDGKSIGTIGIHPNEIGMNFLYKETLKHFR